MRRLLPLPLLALAALVLPGCISLSTATTAQKTSMGPVTLTVGACANGSPGCPASAHGGSVYGFLQGAGSTDPIKGQALLAVRLLEGTTPPVNLLATMSGGGNLAFVTAEDYAAELELLEPAPEGQRWWGWRSSTFDYTHTGKQGFTVSFDVPLPRPADGGPLPSPMPWRPVVGVRLVDGTNAATTAGRPVDCGADTDDLYTGYSEVGSASNTVVCIGDPGPSATRGFLGAPVTDFGITGTTVTTPAGSTTVATFLAKRSGPADPGTAFSLAVAGGPPGATVELDRQSVSLGGDSATPVLATVAVPAGTAPGSYDLTLTATKAGKPTRTGTATIVVPAPAPAPAGDGGGAGAGGGAAKDGATPGGGGPSSGADRPAPVLRRAALTRTRFAATSKRRPAGARLRVDASEAGTLTVGVERLTRGRRAGARCSTRARRGKRCTTARAAGTQRLAVVAGASDLELTRLRGLAPGAYRLALTLTDAAGTRSPTRRLAFTVLRRR